MITVKAGQLLTAVDKVSKVIRITTIPILACIRLTSDVSASVPGVPRSDWLRLAATDLDEWIDAECRVFNSGTIKEVCIPAARLKRLLKAMPKQEYLNIEVLENDVVMIAARFDAMRLDYKFLGLSVASFPYEANVRERMKTNKGV